MLDSEGGGVHLDFFPCKAGLSLHFTDGKSECPGYPLNGGRRGFQMTGALGLFTVLSIVLNHS